MVTSTYLEFDDQATGANNNTWGDVADANFTIFELAIARVLGLATTGGTTTLTTAQNRYPIINVTGVLASNAIIQVRTAEKNWIVINNTTGAFTLTVKTAAGTGKTIPRGRASTVYCDGTNVLLAREQAIPSAQAGGTVDAITATFEPAFIAAEIQDGTIVQVEAAGANTSTAPTFNPDVIGALTIKKHGAQALVAGDIPRIGYKMLLSKDDSGGHWELLNPATPPIFQTKGADIASAGTVTFLDDGDYVHITGTTTITDLDFTTARNGKRVKVVFDGILTLTHHATTLVLPTGANIVTAAGDTAEFVQDSADNIKCLWYQRASGAALSAASGGPPTGTVLPYAGLTEPTDYLFCYGQAISRTTYAALFAVISTTYGVGDGSTTFNLPDLRGRVVAGQDDMGGVSADLLTGLAGGVDGDILGATGGAQTHTLTIAQMPAHSHTYQKADTATGSGAAEVNDGSTASTSSVGGSAAHNNVQPTIILNYIIKAT